MTQENRGPQEAGEKPQALALDAELPRGDEAWVGEATGALYGDLIRELPSAPDHWLAGQIAALLGEPQRAAKVFRDLLYSRAQDVGKAEGELALAPEWPFEPDTGTPKPGLPFGKDTKLAEALLAAARRQRVHPQCVRAPGAATCDEPGHQRKNGKLCPGRRPRLAKWRKLATTDPNQICSWWAMWPNSEVGFAGAMNERPPRVGVAAREPLQEMLGAGVPVFRHVIMAEAEARGINVGAIKRARADLGGISFGGKDPVTGKFGDKLWELPE